MKNIIFLFCLFTVSFSANAASEAKTNQYFDINTIYMALNNGTTAIISDFLRSMGDEELNDEYRKKDILIGLEYMNHPGNKLLYKIALHHTLLFCSLPNSQKSVLYKGIFRFLDEIYDMKFLSFDQDTQSWVNVKAPEAEDTIKQYFLKAFLDIVIYKEPSNLRPLFSEFN